MPEAHALIALCDEAGQSVRAHTGAPSSGQLGEEAGFLPGANGDFDSAQRAGSALSRSELLVHRGIAISCPATGKEFRSP